MNKLKNTQIGGYKFSQGEERPYQQTGNELQPYNEVEVIDLTNEQDIENVINYLNHLKDDPDYEKLSKLKNKKPTKDEFMKMLKQDPAGMFVKKDGKKVSMAQFMKNKKSQNVRKNFNYQNSKESPYGTSGAQGKSPDGYQSMVTNQKKVG